MSSTDDHSFDLDPSPDQTPNREQIKTPGPVSPSGEAAPAVEPLTASTSDTPPEQPTNREQPDSPEPAVPDSEAQTWVEFAPGTPPEQPTMREQPSAPEPAVPASEAQPWEAFAPYTPPEQLSFTEEPTMREQPSAPEPAVPASEAQPWEAFAPYTPPEQLSFTEQAPTEGPVLPPGQAQPWEVFGPNIPPDQQSLYPSGAPPGMPTWGQYQGTDGGVGTIAPPVARESRFKVLAKPLPLWAFIIGIIGIALLLVALQVTGSDWAAGAMQLAYGAGIIALLIALAVGVRTLAGMRRLRAFISAGLIVLILLILSGVGFTQQSPIHRLQGGSLEGQQQWQRAITEYQLAGEHAPTSDNIARTYDEWGEQFSASQHYEAAIAKFDTVLNSYGSAKSEVARAQSDKVAALLAWGKQAMQRGDYATATIHFDDLLGLSYCNSNCQAQGSALDATAYYNLAETQLAAQQYADAANSFNVVVTRFPSSPEAQKLHGDYAKALLGEGQQQLASSCSSAIPTYQELATTFSDTPQGQQAANALRAPQPVTGQFTSSIPTTSQSGVAVAPVAILAKNLYGGISQDKYTRALNGAPVAVIQRDGTFRFKSVRQGTYDLVWGTIGSDGSYSFIFYSDPTTNAPIYVATVGPLCAFDFGAINQPIPTPQFAHLGTSPVSHVVGLNSVSIGVGVSQPGRGQAPFCLCPTYPYYTRLRPSTMFEQGGHFMRI